MGVISHLISSLSGLHRAATLFPRSLSFRLSLFPSLSLGELVIHPLHESGRVEFWKTAVPVTLCQFTFSIPSLSVTSLLLPSALVLYT